MRPLQSPLPEQTLLLGATVLKQTQEASGFRRAQTVPEVVTGHHLNAVSEAFPVTHAVRGTWVRRFAQEGS